MRKRIGYSSYFSAPSYQKGNGLSNFLRGPRFQKGRGLLNNNNKQRGRGIGSFFKSIFSWILPKLKSVAKTIAKGGINLINSAPVQNIVEDGKKSAANAVINTARETLKDTLDGKNVIESLKKNNRINIDQAKNSIKKSISKNLLEKNDNPSRKKKRKNQPFFSSNTPPFPVKRKKKSPNNKNRSLKKPKYII